MSPRIPVLLAVLVGCDRSIECLPPEPAPSGAGGNVLMVVMDDVGVDRLGVYGVHPEPAWTPRLDALADRGVRFDQAYAETVCTPGRAAILTGRRPMTNGVGTNPNPRGKNRGLPKSEVLIPEALKDAPGGPWSSAAIGKWHLATLFRPEPDIEDPRRQGFDHFDGQLGTPTQLVEEAPDGKRGYYRWQRIRDGEVSMVEEYLTTAQADAALYAMETLPEPWFLYLAFSAVHVPLEVPPPDLFEQADTSDPAGVADAMLEALDHELGRVLDAVSDDVTVIVTSDNGTSQLVVRPPLLASRAKGSVYAGGTQVPLLIAGPGIEPAVSSSLVHVTDLFPTVLDLAGIAPGDLGLELDGTSLVPELFGEAPSRRRCVFVESFSPNGDPPREYDQAVRNATHTLVRHPDGPDQLYRRRPTEPREDVDLLDAGGLAEADRDALRELRRLLRHDP
jgi:arylsulfatase A-like enzyme